MDIAPADGIPDDLTKCPSPSTVDVLVELDYMTGHLLTDVALQKVIDEFYQITKGKAVITTDVGQHQMWAAQFCLAEHGVKWLSSGGAGTMGYGFPAAIGAQFGKPKELVAAILGVGGFQTTLSELPTIAIHKLPIKIIIIDNEYLGMVRHWQELFFDNRRSGVDHEPGQYTLLEWQTGIDDDLRYPAQHEVNG